MTKDEFGTELENIVREYNDKLTELVHKAQADEFSGDSWNTNEPLPYYDSNQIEDAIDNIIGHGAWVWDRIRGYNRIKTPRKSLQKKVRKLLGYNG